MNEKRRSKKEKKKGEKKKQKRQKRVFTFLETITFMTLIRQFI